MAEKRESKSGRIGVFIDIQNMNNDTRFDLLFNTLETHGTIELKMAYAEWKDVGLPIRKNMLLNHVKQTQTSQLTTRGKNAADMQIVIDVMNTLYQRDDIDTFVIVAGDTDYVPLINEIASRGKRCILAAHNGKMGTSARECCHEFISLDEFVKDSGICTGNQEPMIDNQLEKINTIETKDDDEIPSITALNQNSKREKKKVQNDKARKNVCRSGGITIENDMSSLTLFPDQWLTVLDEMEKCCCFGSINFATLRDHTENMIDSGLVTFSKSIVVPVLNTFVYHGLFVQPVRGKIAISENYEQIRRSFVDKHQLE